MNKDSFLWLTIGLGVGMLVSAAFTYSAIMEDKKRKDDPRLRKAEDLLKEADNILRAAKKAKNCHIKPVIS